MARLEAVCALVVLAACAPADPGTLDEGAVGELPRACTGGDCPDGRACHAGVCIGESDLAPASDLERATRDAIGRACVRLHGECSEVCGEPFVQCFGSVDACADVWTADYLEDYDFPLFDPVLAAQCAAQIEAAPCTDLRPDTLECEYAVVEGCPGDDDGQGAPYSPFHPAHIDANGTLSVRLCEDVREYFALELAEGERLSVTDPEDSNLRIELYRLIASSRGDAVLEEVIDYFDDGGQPSAPMPDDGLYLLMFRSGSRTGRFTFTLSTTPAS